MSDIVGPSRRGRSPGRWRDRIMEYMCERGATRGGGLDQARRDCFGLGKVETFLGGPSQRERGVRAIVR